MNTNQTPYLSVEETEQLVQTNARLLEHYPDLVLCETIMQAEIASILQCVPSEDYLLLNIDGKYYTPYWWKNLHGRKMVMDAFYANSAYVYRKKRNALEIDWDIYSFLNTPQEGLNGARPYAALATGQTEQVMRVVTAYLAA